LVDFFCDLFGSTMVFIRPCVLLPLLASLAAFAAPVDDIDSSVSTTLDTDLGPELNAYDTPAVDAVSLFTTIITITSAQVNTFTPYTYYASAGYCNPSVTKTWNCGANCNATLGFQPIASGGDGSSIQFCSWCFLKHCINNSAQPCDD
jgi:hypothetical protein